MKYYVVKFNNYGKNYVYKSKLNLHIGYSYNIWCGAQSYNSPVTIKQIAGAEDINISSDLIKEITKINCVGAPPRPNSYIRDVVFNEKKRATTIIWEDGSATTVRCNENDVFNKEAGIALCYMKHFFNDRGCYNEILKKYCKDE